MTERCILFISKGESRASTRYRALDYFPLWQRAGWKPRHRNAPRGLRERKALLRDAAQAKVVVVLRKPFTWPYRGMLRRACRRLVLDLDDAVFLDDTGRPSGLRMRRFVSMARMCDLVWAGNEFLAETGRRFNDKVLMAPTSIDPHKYDLTPERPGETFDMVWIGSSSTRKYLEELMPALELASLRIDNLRLKIIADFDLPSDRLTTLAIPWTAEREAAAIASSHIGLAPMPENPWTRGKCGLKVLQYMAAGVPVIASAAGVHHDIITPEVNGLLADSPEQWVEAIVRLAKEESMRLGLGEAGRARVIERYSLEATMKTLLRSLED